MLQDRFGLPRAAAVLLLALLLATPPALAQTDDKKPAETAAEKPTLTQAITPAENLASVNGVIISREDFEAEMRPLLQRLAMSGQSPDADQMAKLRENVLDNLIHRELLLQEAKKSGYEITDETVEQEMADLKGRFQDEKTFEQMMTQMGIGQDQLRDQIRQRLLIERLIDEKTGGEAAVTDAEVREFYEANPQFFQQPEQIRASHILIKAEPDAEADVKAKARERMADIQTKVKAGGDFAELAREYSEGPSAPQGGDLGYFGRGQMVKPFEDAVFALKSGEVSDIVETPFGYHLIKETGRNPEQTQPFADATDKIREYLKGKKREEALTAYIETLKKDADIQRF